MVFLPAQDGLKKRHARGDAVTGELLQVIPAKRKTQFVQFLQPFLSLFFLLLMDAFQPILQSPAAGVDEKSEKVKVKAVVECIQLEAGEEFHIKFHGKMQAFLNITHGVVVSESNGPQAFVPGHLEDLSRGMLSIRGGVGVNMQVDHRMILLKKGENYNSQGVFVLQILTPNKSTSGIEVEFGLTMSSFRPNFLLLYYPAAC